MIAWHACMDSYKVSATCLSLSKSVLKLIEKVMDMIFSKATKTAWQRKCKMIYSTCVQNNNKPIIGSWIL